MEHDYRGQILDEISVEGLDGITLQALWLRLQNNPHYSLGFSPAAKNFVWEVIITLEDVNFFKLSEERNMLFIHDRYKHMDGDLGIVIEPETLPEDIYPFSLVDDTAAGIKGSCSSYTSRQKVSSDCRKMSLEEAESLGRFLVLVASQSARTEALTGEDYDPLSVANITAMQWAILERIGRARALGEVTQGKLSLQFMNENPKTLFYHRKSLLAKSLIMKQVHHQKAKGQNFQGTLFHLPRFFVERKPKALVLVRKTIEFLKTTPRGMATYEDVKNHLNLGNAAKKLFKTHEFQRYMKGDVRVLHRDLYPDALEDDWQRKGNNQEKTHRVVQLINPNVEPDDVFETGEEDPIEGKVEIEGPDDLEPSSRPASPQAEQTTSGPGPGLLDQSLWVLDRTMMWQAYRLLEKAGPEGLSQQQLGAKLGHGKLEARTICRNLLRRDLVATVMKDIGRQRVTNFVAKKWEHLSSSTTQLRVEKQKMEELVGSRERIKEELHGDAEEESPKKGRKPLRKRSTVEAKLEPPSIPSTPQKRFSVDQSSPNVTASDLCEALEKTNDGSPDSFDTGISDITVTFSSGLDVADKQWKSREKKFSGDAKEKTNGVTFRQLRRANTIIEAVRLHKVIDDPTKLYKIIQENEAKEGYEARMDKKSLMRLISRLEAEGQVKEIRVDLDLAHKKKVLTFICDPDIDESNTVIQSAVEQAKMKFSILPRLQAVKPLKKEVRGQSEDFTSESVTESLAEMMELNPLPGAEKRKLRPPTATSPGKVTYNQRFGRKYGLQPKFVRMRELHLLLHYLIYGYTGNTELDQSSATAKMHHLGLVDTSLTGELQDRRIYCPDISWRMFIPPLPTHQGWGEGWCLMCDVLLRLPLSIFVKLVNITFEVSGLQDYLTHPVRRHYLIRSLPHSIRNKLLYQRKYIFTVHEVATRLAYIGVLQFGPQKLKEKDQVFLFLNQRSSLRDTTTSSPGYHQVTADKMFASTEYALHSMVDVEKFWYDMWLICVYTPLGGSAAVTGQEIILELMDRKPAMIAALSPRSADTAPLNDDGHVPGDGLGAAGLDSSIFAHLKRNWTWNTSAGCRKGDKLIVPPFSMTELPEGNHFRSGMMGTGAGVVLTSTKPNVKRTTKGQKRKASSPEPSSEPPKKKAVEEEVETLSSVQPKTRRPAQYTRVVGRRKTTQERKPYYDEKDKAALRLMRKLRVDWSAGEDSFLLLCKVAGSFLCSNSRNQMVQYTAVRDLLHAHFPESGNKTSRACQRRLNYMMKNPTTADNVALFLADVKQAEEVVNIFSVPEAGTVNRMDNEARLDRDFKPLVQLLLSKYRDDPGTAPRIILPATMEGINQKYSLIFPADPTTKHNFVEPQDTSDIRAGVVNALITSSLCSASDKKSWAFQLFKIYQQYPDSLLRGVMAQLRTSKMVSLKKHYNKTKVKLGNYLPLSSSPYQLSVTFSHTLLCRYQYDIYTQSWQLAGRLLNSQDQHTDVVINQEGGFAATVVGLMARDRLQFRTEVPEQLVVLDPTLSSVDENYVRILTRYKELLRNAGGMDSADLDRICKSPTKLTSTALFTRHQSESEESTRGESVEKALEQGEEGSDLEENLERTGDKQDGDEEGIKKDLNSQVVFYDGEDNSRDTRSNSTVAKSASRIALYMMREEMKDSPLESSSPVQHSHDFFVISSCRVFARLRKIGGKENEPLVNLGSVKAPACELPGNSEAAQKILNKHGVDIMGRWNKNTERFRRTCVPLSANDIDLGKVEDECKAEGWGEKDVEDLGRIEKMVDEKGEMGAVNADIREMKMEGGKNVEEVLEKLLEEYLVVRVGVVVVRYVAYKHAKNWLLHSFKINRVRDVEKMDSLKFSGKLYQGNSGPSTPEEENVLEESDEVAEDASRGKKTNPRRKSRDGLAEAVGGEDIRCNSLWKNPQVGMKLSREVAEAVDKIDWDEVEQVMVNVRPWIRVDGSLNRRVLDRLLGAVLGNVMQWPGQTMWTTLCRFSPALQPSHTRELIWILVELEAVCVHRYIQPAKPTLFSKPCLPTVQLASRLDEDQEVVVEAAVDAITRLGMFIGDKQYTKDFVCQCPCHPDRRM